jgi:hypothetical protein
MRPAHSKNQLSLFQKARELPRREIRAAAYAGEPYMLHALSLVLALCVCAYLYFVGISIMNVIVSREASVESERLQSIVGNLEEQYFTLAKTVTPESAGQFGLVAGADASFVRRGGAVAANVTPSDI